MKIYMVLLVVLIVVPTIFGTCIGMRIDARNLIGYTEKLNGKTLLCTFYWNEPQKPNNFIRIRKAYAPDMVRGYPDYYPQDQELMYQLFQSKNLHFPKKLLLRNGQLTTADPAWDKDLVDVTFCTEPFSECEKNGIVKTVIKYGKIK